METIMETDPKRCDSEEILKLAARAVARVDRQGPRGVTMVTHAETEALVIVALMSGLLPAPNTRLVRSPMFRTTRKSA
jgi:hypothetical protein